MQKIKRINFLIILTLLLQLPIFGNKALAANVDYTIDDGKRVPIPKTYILDKVISNLGDLYNSGEESGYLKEPEDLFVNEQGFLFVADTGNDRIVKLDQEGKLIDVFYGPKDKKLKSPQGVFADDKGNMYIADTENCRIVHLDAEGNYVEEFVKPDSELLGETFTFDPSKIYVSPTGYIYAVKGQSILILDAYNRFKGYLGQTEIGYSLVDTLLRIFASEEQKKVIRKRSAAVYTNITMDNSGVIYATSLDMNEGEIKKLNSVGKNIYRKYSTATGKFFDFLTTMKLEGKSFVFGERFNDDGLPIKPMFKDLAVDEKGIITALEEQTGKIYQYDQRGNILAVFGGKGDQKGRFNMPSSVAVGKAGQIYVLDKVNANIQVFTPTKFITLIHDAVNKFSEGNYEDAYSVWNEVLKIDENYSLAHLGLANALYKQEKWKDAMQEYMLADDRAGYSKCYVEYRYEFFRQNFIWIVLGLILLVAIIIFFIRFLKNIANNALSGMYNRRSRKMSVLDGLKMSLGVIFHPHETFDRVKNNRGRINVLSGVIILLVVLASRLFYLFVVHYPMQDIDLKQSNIWLEAVKLLLPPVTWVIASFAISAIMDGESKIDEIFISSTYCMVPYAIITFPLAVISNVLTSEEQTFYALVSNGVWIWILILFFISLKTLNDYKLFKTAVTYTISGVNMGLLWFVAMLGYVLTGRLYQFITGIIHEIKMTWM